MSGENPSLIYIRGFIVNHDYLRTICLMLSLLEKSTQIINLPHLIKIQHNVRLLTFFINSNEQH